MPVGAPPPGTPADHFRQIVAVLGEEPIEHKREVLPQNPGVAAEVGPVPSILSQHLRQVVHLHAGGCKLEIHLVIACDRQILTVESVPIGHLPSKSCSRASSGSVSQCPWRIGSGSKFRPGASRNPRNKNE